MSKDIKLTHLSTTACEFGIVVNMKTLHIETPFFESRALTIGSNRIVWLKLEAMQPPGSFKIRGIGFACQECFHRGAKRFISSSDGNAGIAVVVVVPETTTDRAKALIQQEGAELVVHGSSWQEANALALSMIKESDAL
jgi:L-serine/L-threonine ammonia-lyase